MTDEHAALPATAAALVERIQEERAALDQLVERLDEATMLAPGAERWSVKDHLVHIATWERILLVVHLQGRTFGEAAGMDEATSRATEHMTAEDGLNDYFFERDRELPLPRVLATFREMHQQLLEAIEAHDEASLLARPLIEHIADNTYEHYREHRAIIEVLASTG